ncbi:MAG: diguanylate cyclase [Candidatus Obscuribacterales bacterium]|nr:diguanylate cyclase [Steroidobacteraceae bacterium]
MISASDILGAKILIVDDQQANVMLLWKMLTGIGYTCVASTTNPHEVCALHQQNHYDLILLDLQMPGMDGFAVMEALKEIDADDYLPILVITAQPGHKLRALTGGAKDFISKPFDMLEAKTRINNMLEVRLLYKQLQQYNHALESLALHDPLTGLPNRQLLMDRLLLAISHARRNNGTMATMYLDLDGFKQINDTMGHDVGDALLTMVAARLVAAVRQEDTVARVGGDEFVIAFWELTHAEGANKVASKIIQSVSQPYSIQGHTVNITASVGVSIYPTNGAEVETLMKSADLALYEAKRSGKNVYRIASGQASGHERLAVA